MPKGIFFSILHADPLCCVVQAGKDAAHAERLQEELQRALAEAAALQNK